MKWSNSMPAEHVKNIELALSYMRDARRSAVKNLATGSKSSEHQRGTTDDNMDRLVGYQRVINSLLAAREDELGLPPSDTAGQGSRGLPTRQYAEEADE
jgi:hypothetical protein